MLFSLPRVVEQTLAVTGSSWTLAATPSFKCSKDAHEVEVLICKDDELARLDVSLSKLDNTVMKRTPKSAPERRIKRCSGQNRADG